MLPLLLTVVLASSPAESSTEAGRQVTVAVYTGNEAPVGDLRMEELEIKENGQRRAVLGLERDERRVDVALILDSSAAMGPEYRSSLVAAAMVFWKALPEEARLSVWTSGTAPSKVVDFDIEPGAGEALLQQVATAGLNATLHTIIDASRDLQRQRGRRRYVVIVTNSVIDASRELIQRTFRMIARARVTPMVVLVKRHADAAQTWDTETIFEQMTDGYGGSYDLVLTPQASHKLLQRVAADLSSQYLVRYESATEKPGRPEVKVKRKDVRVRVGLSQNAR